MALHRRALLSLQGRGGRNFAVLRTSCPLVDGSDYLHECSSPPFQSKPQVRPFSSLLAKWQAVRVSSKNAMEEAGNGLFQGLSVLQKRHIFVEVVDNDLDSALKVYNKKMNLCKLDEQLRARQFYTKPSEHRKLAKHYKKLNRARRELGQKLKIVNHRMEKIQEVRRLEKEERRAKASAAAAAAATAEAKGRH